MDIEAAGQILGIIVVSTTSLWGFYVWSRKKIYRPFTTFIKKATRAIETLGPNGGSTLFDTIQRIECASTKADVRAKTLAVQIGIGEWTTNTDGECTFVNGTVCTRTARPESDFLGNNWINVVHPEDRERVHREWNEAIREQRTFVSSYRWTDARGQTIHIRVTASPAIDTKGVNHGWSAFVSFEDKK